MYKLVEPNLIRAKILVYPSPLKFHLMSASVRTQLDRQR
jgi:hypothetical protein